MAFFDFLFGKKGRTEQLPILTPEQQQYLRQVYSGGGLEASPLYQQGASFLQQLLSNEPGAFEQFAAPEMARFQQSTVPSLAQRFVGQGTGSGGLSSSGFAQTLAQAGSGLQRDLGAMRAGLQSNALGQALQYAQQPQANRLSALGARQFENVYHQPTMGFFPGILSNIAGGFGGQFGFNRGYGGF